MAPIIASFFFTPCSLLWNRTEGTASWWCLLCHEQLPDATLLYPRWANRELSFFIRWPNKILFCIVSRCINPLNSRNYSRVWSRRHMRPFLEKPIGEVIMETREQTVKRSKEPIELFCIYWYLPVNQSTSYRKCLHSSLRVLSAQSCSLLGDRTGRHVHCAAYLSLEGCWPLETCDLIWWDDLVGDLEEGFMCVNG